jgi:hypothetical protein
MTLDPGGSRPRDPCLPESTTLQRCEQIAPQARERVHGAPGSAFSFLFEKRRRPTSRTSSDGQRALPVTGQTDASSLPVIKPRKYRCGFSQLMFGRKPTPD